MIEQNDDLYDGREQTKAKHSILRRYLEELCYKVGSSWTEIIYIDCFAGPWMHKDDEELSDTSPGIACETLANVKRELAKRRNITVHALFIESDRKSAANLRSFIKRRRQKGDLDRLDMFEGDFKESVPAIDAFIAECRRPFVFVFMDPTGWKDLQIRLITHILRQRSSEVIINLMTKHIMRFQNLDPLKQSFMKVFDEDTHDAQDDETKAKNFTTMLRTRCHFEYSTYTKIYEPGQKNPHFYLVFGTHHQQGLVVFRKVEERAFDGQRKTATQISLKKNPDQGLLPFPEDDIEANIGMAGYYKAERIDARLLAKKDVWGWLKHNRCVQYDDLVGYALCLPHVSQSVLKKWLL